MGFRIPPVSPSWSLMWQFPPAVTGEAGNDSPHWDCGQSLRSNKFWTFTLLDLTHRYPGFCLHACQNPGSPLICLSKLPLVFCPVSTFLSCFFILVFSEITLFCFIFLWSSRSLSFSYPSGLGRTPAMISAFGGAISSLCTNSTLHSV